MSIKYELFMLIFIYFIINIIIFSVFLYIFLLNAKNCKQFAYLNTNRLHLLHNLLTL